MYLNTIKHNNHLVNINNSDFYVKSIIHIIKSPKERGIFKNIRYRRCKIKIITCYISVITGMM